MKHHLMESDVKPLLHAKTITTLDRRTAGSGMRIEERMTDSGESMSAMDRPILHNRFINFLSGEILLRYTLCVGKFI